MFKMPEPTYFTWTDFESKVHHHPYYSEAQVKQVRAEALEEAAKVCQGINEGCLGAPDGPEDCAEAIRKLKEGL